MNVSRVSEPPVEPKVFDEFDLFSDTPEPAGPPESSETASKPSTTLEIPTDPNEFSHPSVTVAFTFKVSLCSQLPKHSPVLLDANVRSLLVSSGDLCCPKEVVR